MATYGGYLQSRYLKWPGIYHRYNNILMDHNVYYYYMIEFLGRNSICWFWGFFGFGFRENLRRKLSVAGFNPLEKYDRHWDWWSQILLEHKNSWHRPQELVVFIGPWQLRLLIIYIYIYTYLHIYIYTYLHIYIYMYIYKMRSLFA